MPESSLETVVPEREFAHQLPGIARPFAGRLRALLAARDKPWTKREFFALDAEADQLEAVLDDYGARYNRTFCFLTELTASIRGFSLAGLSLAHMLMRLDGYSVLEALPADDRDTARDDLMSARDFVQSSLVSLLEAWWQEALKLGLAFEAEAAEELGPKTEPQRFRLPRTVGQQDLANEQQRIAEVASKYLQACVMLEEARLLPVGTESQRAALLAARCSEEQARVYEATIHNLQSAYDTYVGNTRLEASDERLRRLRGFVSCSLHLLEAVTQLTHFVERHEGEERSETGQVDLNAIVPRAAVQQQMLDVLLHWVQRLMFLGKPLAEALLPTYTNLQELEVTLADGITFHARPASLVVSIVNHYGTPVEMELSGKTINAGSILELMVLVGSHPDVRRYVFRGDERPLADIAKLFECALGENGLDVLPESLGYLRR